jgi:hypothetical protein
VALTNLEVIEEGAISATQVTHLRLWRVDVNQAVVA